MGSHLLSAFATANPARFAELLGTAQDVAESQSILGQIPVGMQADVVSRLPPESAGRLLDNLRDQEIIAWLEAGPADAGRRLLSRAGRERAKRLLDGVGDRARRRGLRQMTTYPPGSIGELVRMQVTVVRSDELAEDLRERFGQSGSEPEGPVVVLGRDDSVLGVLDLMKFVSNSRPEARAADFLIRVEPLIADSPAASIRHPAEWARLTNRPVVDEGGRLIGYVTRAALETAGGAEGGFFMDSLVELARRYWAFEIHVMTALLDRRSGS